MPASCPPVARLLHADYPPLTRLLHRLRARTPAIDEEGFICGNTFENDSVFPPERQKEKEDNSRGLIVERQKEGGARGGPTRGTLQITADDGSDGRGETERGGLGREGVPLSRREGVPISRPMCRPVV